MNFLFFDIECANCFEGGKLCEFGYVLTDEKFNILIRENLLINPEDEFDQYVLNDILNYKKSDYLFSPNFEAVYQKIYDLLSEKNNIVVGHTTTGDACHIGDDCIRYKKKCPDFVFYDIVEIYKLFSKKTEATGLTKMCEELNIELNEKAHSADVDAYYSMLVLRSLTENFNCSFFELIKMAKASKGKLFNYEEIYRKKKNVEIYFKNHLKENEQLLSHEQLKNINIYMRKIRINKNGKMLFFNKQICISSNYIKTHYFPMLNIINKVAKNGGKMTKNVSKCDIFVRFDVDFNGEILYCKQLETALEEKETGRDIDIVLFDDFIKKLNLNEQELNKEIQIDFDQFSNSDVEKYFSNNSQVSIGEILKNKAK